MKRNIQVIPLDLIILDQENVRFGGDVAQNQREAIELMMADPDDSKKLLKLAEHIAKHGLDPTELQLVVPSKDDRYIVLEGNRRLTALKLLQKPDLCPDEKLVKSFIKASDTLNGNLPKEIECSVVSSRQAGDLWVELKHTGQNSGIGRVNWDSNIRDERRARQTGIESIGRQIRELIKDNPSIFSGKVKRDVLKIPVTTLTRLFSSKPAQDAFQLKVVNKLLEPQLELKSIAPSVEFALNLFTNEGYNVNDIRSNDDRYRFIGHIPPELHPSKLVDNKPTFSEAQNNNNSAVSNNTEANIEQDTEVNNRQALSSPNEQVSSSEPVKKTIAKKSSKARKYLTPWSLSIPNERINAIYRELRTHLEVDKCPNSVAITFRAFIEVTCDEYVLSQKKVGSSVVRTDNNKPLTNDDKLSVKVRSVVKDLENKGKIDKSVAKALIKRAGSHDSVGSIDHFNQFVHSAASMPLPSELKDIADEYKPFLAAIWQ